MPASMTDFRRVAHDVCNWGRWGEADELGTLNFITADKVAEAASLVKQGKVFALGADFGSAGPQGAFQFRQNPTHVMTVDGGDAATLTKYGPQWLLNSVAHQVSEFFVDNPFRFNDDMIVMPLQAATQWDALSHVYYEDRLYNGFPADSVTSFGAFHCSIDKVDVKGITSRGVLLDVVRHRAPRCSSNPETPSRQRNSTPWPRHRACKSGAGTSSSCTPDGGHGSCPPATGPNPDPVWTGGVPHGCTITRSRPWPPTTSWSRIPTRHRVWRARSCRCTCCACATWA